MRVRCGRNSFAPELIGLFRDDPEVIRIGATALRLICISLPFSAFMSCVSTLFQVVGRTLASSILVFSRQILFYVPALLILPRLLGLIGLQASGTAGGSSEFLPWRSRWYFITSKNSKNQRAKTLELGVYFRLYPIGKYNRLPKWVFRQISVRRRRGVRRRQAWNRNDWWHIFSERCDTPRSRDACESGRCRSL